MAGKPLNLVIDARPQGPRGLFAAEVLLGRSILSRLIEQAVAAVGPGCKVVVLSDQSQKAELAPLLTEADRGRVEVRDHQPAGAAVLLTDRLYDVRRLCRAVRAGRDPESAVFWRLDRPEALDGAEQELNRRLNYQPIGRYWAFPLADRLASALRFSRVVPNALTLAAGGLMLFGAVLVALGGLGWPGRLAAALAFATALVLDTADGRLARLQNACTGFGRWLDQVLDELADLALHAAIAWSAFIAHGHPAWLLLGIAFASGKYMFLIQSLTGESLEAQTERKPAEPSKPQGVLRRVVHLLGHADVRWHLWIVLAAIGRLDAALVIYAVYFPVRALAGILRKGVAYA